MKYSFPAIFRIDNEDDRYINVVFPDIYGAVTFGENMEDAMHMAKDLLIAMEDELKVSTPTSLEETRNNFPEDIVEMVEVEI